MVLCFHIPIDSEVNGIPIKMTKLPILFISLVFVCNSVYASRAMWVWNTSQVNDIIRDVGSARSAFFDFCANPPGSDDSNAIPGNPEKISTIYLDAYSYVSGSALNKTYLRSFLTDAHNAGISVEYLDGDAQWTASDSGQAEGEQHCQEALEFNSGSSDAAQRFDGIHYDVEPWNLSDWDSKISNYWSRYKLLLGNCQDKVNGYNSGCNPDISFAVDIVFWFDSDVSTTTNNAEIQDIVDYVAIMAYHEDQSNMINFVQNEIDYATTIGKEVIVAVETQSLTPYTTSYPETVTFYQEGWGNMEGRLFRFCDAYKNMSGFSGIAVHCFDSYQNLTKWGMDDGGGEYGKDLTPPALVQSIPEDNSIVHALPQIKLKIVDICGSGVDADSTIADADVFCPGLWSCRDSRYLTFSPDSILASGDYSLTVCPVDSNGNKYSPGDTIGFTLSYCSVPSDVYAYPNPVSKSRGSECYVTNIPDAGEIQVRIYTVDGMLVRNLKQPDEVKNGYAYWDCRNDSGQGVACGLYVYWVSTGVGVETGKIIITP